MKKTVNVNINGRAFVIDENAYLLLDNYLKNLKYYFRKEEGADDIIADFESRIEELLSERLRLGAQVINQEHVEEVIARVGKPGEFAEEDSRAEEATQSAAQETKRKLFRNPDNKMLGGIFSGLGAFFGCDVTLLRIIGVILLFVTQLVIVPIYLVMWLIVPEARTAAEKLQMQGKPITLENIGKTVSQEADQVINNNRSFIDGLLHAFVVILKILAVGIGLLIGLPLLFAFFIVIIVLFAVLFGVGSGLLGALPFGLGEGLSYISVQHPILASITLIIVIGLPLIALIYAIISHFAKFKPMDRSVKWMLFAVWIISFVLFFCSGFRLNASASDIHRTFSLFPFFNLKWNATTMYDDDFEYVDDHDFILSEEEFVLDGHFDKIRFVDMIASVEIKQIATGPATMTVSGDNRLVKRLKYEISDNQLIVECGKKRTHIGLNTRKFTVAICTPELKALEYSGIGELFIPGALYSDELDILQNSAGKFDADSLYVKRLKINANGVGAVFVAGQTANCELKMKGIGALDAGELKADTVNASVEGIGSLSCFPLKYLDAKVNGIGKITYLNEPNYKILVKVGLGSIEKE